MDEAAGKGEDAEDFLERTSAINDDPEAFYRRHRRGIEKLRKIGLSDAEIEKATAHPMPAWLRGS